MLWDYVLVDPFCAYYTKSEDQSVLIGPNSLKDRRDQNDAILYIHSSSLELPTLA